MKTRKKILLYLPLLSILLLTSCSINFSQLSESTPTLENTIIPATITPTFTLAPPTSTPTEIPPTLTPTLVPTARPLQGARAEEPGVYRNEILGVSLRYPADFEVIASNQSGFTLLGIKNSGENTYILVYFETFFRDDEESFDEAVMSSFDNIGDALEISNPGEIEAELVYEITTGIYAWRGIQRNAHHGGTLEVEIIAIEWNNRMYEIQMIGYDNLRREFNAELELIRHGLSFFPPTPYGVDRENAMFLAGGDPESFDPAINMGSAGSFLSDVYSGLVRLDTNLEVIGDLAESWEISPDGSVYTFFLRENVVFHTGRPFTAHDVVYSWNRAANPDTASPHVATYMDDILGIQEVFNGTASEISGLNVIDDYTLEVTLIGPRAYFLAKIAYPISWIVDQETIDQIEEHPIGTGPFRFVRYEEEEILILARNEFYHLGYVPLEYRVYLIYQGYSIRLYEAGMIDLVWIDEDLLERAEDPNDPLYGNIHTSTGLCTSFVRFDNTMAPFNDILVREAFARAVNQELFFELTTEGEGARANGLYPPGLPGFNPDVQALQFNPNRAEEALAESTYGSADALPEIVFTISGYGGGTPPYVAALINMWQDTLGVSVSVEQIEGERYQDELMSGNHGQILFSGWCADYPDPGNFADSLFFSSNPMNPGYSNPGIDQLLINARGEQDVDTRMITYQVIEQMLIDDFAAVFLLHSQASYVVTQPYILGYENPPISVAQAMNIWIERTE